MSKEWVWTQGASVNALKELSPGKQLLLTRAMLLVLLTRQILYNHKWQIIIVKNYLVIHFTQWINYDVLFSIITVFYLKLELPQPVLHMISPLGQLYSYCWAIYYLTWNEGLVSKTNMLQKECAWLQMSAVLIMHPFSLQSSFHNADVSWALDSIQCFLE